GRTRGHPVPQLQRGPRRRRRPRPPGRPRLRPPPRPGRRRHRLRVATRRPRRTQTWPGRRHYPPPMTSRRTPLARVLLALTGLLSMVVLVAVPTAQCLACRAPLTRDDASLVRVFGELEPSFRWGAYAMLVALVLLIVFVAALGAELRDIGAARGARRCGVGRRRAHPLAAAADRVGRLRRRRGRAGVGHAGDRCRARDGVARRPECRPRRPRCAERPARGAGLGVPPLSSSEYGAARTP